MQDVSLKKGYKNMDEELIKINNKIISLKEKIIDCKKKLTDAHVLYHTENKTTPVHIIKSLESKVEIYKDMISIEILKKENLNIRNKYKKDEKSVNRIVKLFEQLNKKEKEKDEEYRSIES